jgi:sugar lactone lactonase YvrE
MTTGETMLSIAQGTDALDQLIDPAQDFTQIGSGFLFTEGPAWNVAGTYLVFSDIPGDARWRWSERHGMELDARPTYKGNGMVYEPDGCLLVAACDVKNAAGARPKKLG